MSTKLIEQHRKSIFRSPPKLQQKAAPEKTQPQAPVDTLEKATPLPKKGIGFMAASLQLGLAINSLSGGQAQAAPTEIVQVLEDTRQRSEHDLSIGEAHYLRLYEDNFERRRFTTSDAQESLRYFSSEAKILNPNRRSDGPMSPERALRRLTGRDRTRVQIQMPNGRVYNVRNLEELQELDTFFGVAVNPAVSEQTLEALNTLTKTESAEDGVFREGTLILGEQRVDSYQAFKYLTQGDQRQRKSIGTGAAIGLAVAGTGVALTAAFVPGAAAAIVAGGTGLAMAGGAVAAGIGLGALAGHQHFERLHKNELSIRRGIDRGLKLHNLDHAVEAHFWLQAREVAPFTARQQTMVAENFSTRNGLFHRDRQITAERAIELLNEGKEVKIPSTIPNHSDTLSNLRDLQILDTLRGLQVNPVLSREVSDSLRYLESGAQEGDGLYRRQVTTNHRSRGRGTGQTVVSHTSRLSAFEAVDYLFRERQTIGVTLGGKKYHTETLVDIQELNALLGDGVNTILPRNHFRALRAFDQGRQIFDQYKRERLDSYEALQEVQAGRPVRVQSEGRKALLASTEDFQELWSLEAQQQNTILPQRDFDLLNHWQDNGAYRVDNDGETDRAYEALQAIQRKEEFEVASQGRYAPALHFQDLEDLSTFETPEAGFPNSVPTEDFDRLVHFQTVAESQGGATTRVGRREGRAYEGYRELRDGDHFDVSAGGVWNRVTSSDSLHDLDAMLGRQVNDILPQDQYDLLKLLGDEPVGEGLHTRGERVNSYAALQEFRAGRDLSYDFHGGDFGELLQIRTPNLESLENTRELRDNQKDYDQYAYPVDEWRDKMERQATQTPSLADQNLRYGQGELREGQSDLRRGRSDLSDAQSDLRRGRSDLRSAESDLRRARAMPRYTSDYEWKCGYDGECGYEWVQNYNYRRDREIRRARNDVSDAESDIRRARSDISSAESLIRRARADIRTAEGYISDAEQILAGLPDFQQSVSGTTEANYAQRVAELRAELAEMRSQSHIAPLTTNIGRQQKLIGNMESRPERPEGWEVPERLVQR